MHPMREKEKPREAGQKSERVSVHIVKVWTNLATSIAILTQVDL